MVVTNKTTEKTLNLNPDVLVALRKTSGYSRKEIAKKLGLSIKKISDIEKGKSFFTLSQIKRLADIYKRPLAAFFLSSANIIKFPNFNDYRLKNRKKLTPEICLALRKASYLADKVKELSGKKSVKLSFSSNELGAEDLAKEFIKYLDMNNTNICNMCNLLSQTKINIEKLLYIIIIEYPFKNKNINSFSITNDVCAIVLNEKDPPKTKLFSLLHETGYYFVKNNKIMSTKHKKTIEKYCNKFASIVFEHLTNKHLKNLNKKKTKKEYTKEEKEILQKEKEYTKIRNRVGNIVIQEVEKAYKNKDITFYDVLEILDIKSSQFHDLINI